MAQPVGHDQLGGSPAVRVGGYLLGRRLGQGGMGSVFEATHENIGQRAAVKILHPHLTQDQAVVGRFLNEARAVSIVQHPGLVKIFDFGRLPDGTLYILMELLPGESLLERLRRRRSLTLPEAVRITRQIASALDAAHQKGIVHRDLKPSNVVIVPDPEAAGGERAKLLDFGVAKLQDVNSQDGDYRTEVGAILGTPAYMAPEQARGEAIDGRADVYSLGVMLHQMICGRLPFRGESPTSQLAQHMTVAPPSLAQEAPGTPAVLTELVLTMLAKEARLRPVAAQVAHLLERSQDDMVTVGLFSRAAAATVAVPTISAVAQVPSGVITPTPSFSGAPAWAETAFTPLPELPRINPRATVVTSPGMLNFGPAPRLPSEPLSVSSLHPESPSLLGPRSCLPSSETPRTAPRIEGRPTLPPARRRRALRFGLALLILATLSLALTYLMRTASVLRENSEGREQPAQLTR